MSEPAEHDRHDQMLDDLQRESFNYFIYETNPANGLVLDKTDTGIPWPCSIAAVGLGLSAYPVAVERGWMPRTEAAERALTTVRFFADSPQGTEPDATGYRGFYYHFLDMNTGRRTWHCELSTMDTAILLAGALAAAQYFDREDGRERELGRLADGLYRRADWRWAQNGGDCVAQGWKPESGFLPYSWEGYSEALLLYVLGLGSPTHPLSPQSYPGFTSTYEWKSVYGRDYLYAGPLFIHQFSHIWIDFREIQDDYMRAQGSDYFENSRHATYVQQEYAMRNPQGFKGYGEFAWGITASDGPGLLTRRLDGVQRQFYDYFARGVPYGPDDGTLAPWAVVAALPFAPEIVLPTVRAFDAQEHLRHATRLYGFKATFNPTFPGEHNDGPYGWVSPWHFGLNEGPVVLMIENYRTGLFWELMKRCSDVSGGLRRAGFRGGWLDAMG